MNFCLKYMMAERQNRIDKNNQKILELQSLLDHDCEYIQCTTILNKIEEKLKKLDACEQSYELQYQNYRNSQIREIYSNQIQLFTNEIAETMEKINMIQFMKEQIQKHKKCHIILLFKQYHKQKKQIAQEELAENISWISSIVPFFQTYYSIKQKQYNMNRMISVSEQASFLLDYYLKNNQYLKQELEKAETHLSYIRDFITNYKTRKNQIQSKKLELMQLKETTENYLQMILQKRDQLKQQIYSLQNDNLKYSNQTVKLKDCLIEEQVDESIISRQKIKNIA